MGTDGEDFINVYSKGQTPLGRFLSNFEKCNLDLPEGNFKSVEGYWYYLNCDPGLDREALKSTSGNLAKVLGRSLKAKDWNEALDFQLKIKFAIFQKLERNPFFFNRLKACKLPLKHYYVYAGRRIEPKEGQWILDFLNSFRAANYEL